MKIKFIYAVFLCVWFICPTTIEASQPFVASEADLKKMTAIFTLMNTVQDFDVDTTRTAMQELEKPCPSNLLQLACCSFKGLDAASFKRDEESEAKLQAMIRFLVEQKAEVNKPSDDGITALHQAVTFGRPTTVQLLLNLQADVNAVSAKGAPLDLVCSNHVSSETMELLLKHGASFRQSSDPALVKEIGLTTLDFFCKRAPSKREQWNDDIEKKLKLLLVRYDFGTVDDQGRDIAERILCDPTMSGIQKAVALSWMNAVKDAQCDELNSIIAAATDLPPDMTELVQEYLVKKPAYTQPDGVFKTVIMTHLRQNLSARKAASKS